MKLLQAHKLAKRFDGVLAVDDCSFAVESGSITALIGPNGAGKTTVFNIITGLLRPDSGEISFQGEPLLDLEAHEIARLGIARTFQMLRIFPKLTALENLLIAHPGKAEGMFDLLFRRRTVRGEEAAQAERALEILARVNLRQFANVSAGSLSYGQQKLLDIARCIMTGADLLLLDEPVAGVNPAVRQGIKKLLRELKAEGRTILLIEHDMSFVMDLSDTIIVLDHGEEIAIGSPYTIRKDKKVVEAYLGT